MFKLIALMDDDSIVNCGIHRSKKECGEVAETMYQWLYENYDIEPMLFVIVPK